MPMLGLIVWYILWAYSLVLWGRFILEWIRQLAPRWRPRGLVLVLAETVFTVTDPPLRFLRRRIKPVRLGAVAIDFSWTILLMALYLAMSLVA